MRWVRTLWWLVALAALTLGGCGESPAPTVPRPAPRPTPVSKAASIVAPMPAPAAAPSATPGAAPAAAPASAPAPVVARPVHTGLPGPPDTKRFPAPFTTEPAPMAGTIDFVADGDTVRITLAARSVMVRLLGVNTPEKKSKYRRAEPWGAKVAGIARAAWLGKRVELIADLNATDKYDRVLGYVTLDGKDLGEWLLQQGYARIFAPAAHPRRVHYFKLQALARDAGVGLWGGTPATASGRGGVGGVGGAVSVVGNRQSKVMHAPDCASLPSERNRVPLASRAAAEAAGYRAHRCLTK